MGKRQQRHDVVRDINCDRNIKTRHDLTDRLHVADYDCVQARLSLDIMGINVKNTLGAVAVGNIGFVATETPETALAVDRAIDRLRRR